MIRRLAYALSPMFPLLAGTAFVASSVAGGAAEVPVFESNSAVVEAIFAGKTADVVIFNAGYEQNFCTGALCRVERAGVPVAEIIIAEASRERAAALIVQLENTQTIQTGDTVKLKTI